MSTRSKIAFISGHLSLTMREFIDHYEDRIKEAIREGHHFVVGDAPGADWLAQGLLFSYLPPNEYNRVTVYHMLTNPRYHVSHFSTYGGFQSNEKKDAAMTMISDYDIAWVRPGREDSGTARNLKRREVKNGSL